MLDFTKPPTKEQVDTWPPLTLNDVYEIEESSGDQFEAVFSGDMGRARTMALVHAHKIAAMWPQIVTTAMMLWEAQRELSALRSTESVAKVLKSLREIAVDAKPCGYVLSDKARLAAIRMYIDETIENIGKSHPADSNKGGV